MIRSLRSLRSWWDFSHRHRIPANALVVDVGCGHMPNMRANILADKFIADDAERQQPIALDERPFVVCDALHLPFKDGSVDYVICSHLAEHVEEPEALFAELTRVAAAGYVECPARVREMLHGWEFHRWYVEVEGGRLVFEEKPRPLHDEDLHEWFSRHFETDPAFESFFVDNMERLGLVAAYDWVGKIDYAIKRLPQSAFRRTAAKLSARGPVGREQFASLLARVPVRSLTRNERVKQRLARLARRRSDPLAAVRLRSMLCCPKCKGELGDRHGELLCAPCGASFPITGNVYYLVPEQVAGWRPQALAEAVAQH